MIDEVGDELPDHPDREHFHAERAAETGAAGVAMAICNAELAIAVNRGRSHDIAGLVEARRRRLAPRRQAIHDMVEQPGALVGAGENQVGVAVASGLLLRRVDPQTLDFITAGYAVIQHKRSVPGFGDHPVGAQRRVEVAGETDQRTGPLRPPRGIDGGADAVAADFPAVVAEAVSFSRNMAQHRPQETQPRLVERAEAGEPHDRFRRPQPEAAPRSTVFDRTEVSGAARIGPVSRETGHASRFLAAAHSRSPTRPLRIRRKIESGRS